MTDATSTWPHGARLAVSFSLMFEAGGQPISGAGGVIPEPIQQGSPDLPTNPFFEYGVYEGIPRLLDLFDKRPFAQTTRQASHDRPEALRRYKISSNNMSENFSTSCYGCAAAPKSVGHPLARARF